MATISLVSLGVSILGAAVFYLLLEAPDLLSFLGILPVLLFIALALASVILPPIAKKKRLDQWKKGTIVEIIAIAIGGLNFAGIFIFLDFLPFFLAYLGWMGCIIAYLMIK